MKFGGILAGVAVAAAKADGQPLIDHAAGGVQHLAEHHFVGRLAGKGFPVPGTEHPVAGGEAAVAGYADDADGGGGAAGGNGGNEIHQINS